MDDARVPLPPWPDDQFVDYAQARQHVLLRAAYLVCGDLRVAEDLLREAFVQLARQWERVREEQPDLFVRRLLYREAVASWRKRPHEAVAATPATPATPAASAASAWDEPDEQWDDEEAERRLEVLCALDALTPRQRAVVVLSWFEERGVGEIAEVLGCSTTSVRTQADEALTRLRAALPRVDLTTGGAR